MLPIVDICHALIAGKKVSQEDLERLGLFVSMSSVQNSVAKQTTITDIEIREMLSQTIGLTKYGNIITNPNLPGTTPKIEFSSSTRTFLELNSDCWDFDASQLQEKTNGHALYTLLLWLFEKHNLFDDLPIPFDNFGRFALKLESAYPAFPYHNTTHACEVLQATHMILHHTSVIQKLTSMMHPRNSFAVLLASAYIAAAGHDVSHTGVTNEFLVRSKSSLAMRFNDVSCNENLHLNVLLRFLDEEKLLVDFREETKRFVRDIIISMVLHTDLHHHFQSCADFQSRDLDASEGLDQTVRIVLQMTLKCADLVHTTQSWKRHYKRVQALEEEYRLQGDRERAANLTISPLMDRQKSGLTKAQVPFLMTIVKPMFDGFRQRFPLIQTYIQQLDSNISQWGKLAR